MMYHLSNFLEPKEQLVEPKTKYRLDFKYALYKILIDNFKGFCELYSDFKYANDIENCLGWRKTKLFCECIFELARQNIGCYKLFPRMMSFYLSKSLTDINEFKQYSNRSGTIFEVDISIENCQKYDMELFTDAEIYLSNQNELNEEVFNKCYEYATYYWNGETSDKPIYEYLYYGKINIKPII